MFGFLKDILEWFWPTKPWRGDDIQWNKEWNDHLIKIIHQLQPKTKQNISILGPVGAGKSSFINSVVSIDKGRKYGMAMTGDSGVFGSWTKDVAVYSNGKLLKGYRLFDCMGIEPSDEGGVLVADLLFLIKGHIHKGYQFKPNKPINENDPCYRSKPTFENQMHCVIIVVSADSVHNLQDEYVNKIRELQLKLKAENIPKVMVLTKVDLICNEVATDKTKMFKSSKVHETVNLASEKFGIERASIHPVVNYVNDPNIRHEMNIPILLALRQAMHYSKDKVDYVEQENSDDGGENKQI